MSASKASSTYKEVNKNVIMLAALALTGDDETLIEELGLDQLDDSIIRRLINLTIEQLNYVADFRGTLVDIRFNPRQLSLYLEMAARKQAENDLVNRAIQSGMRQFMLEKYTGLSRREYSIRRKQLNLPGHEKGRIEMLNEVEEVKVIREWSSLCETEENELERYCQLYERTGISLDRVFQVIEQQSISA